MSEMPTVQTRYRIVAVYEIYAGLVGLLHALHPHLLTGVTSVTFNLMAVVPCLISTALGALMWTGAQNAVLCSAVFQAIQIPRLAAAHLHVSLLVGTELSLMFRGPVASLWTTTGVTFQLGAVSTSQGGMIGVNLIGLTALLLSLGAKASATNAQGDAVYPMGA